MRRFLRVVAVLGAVLAAACTGAAGAAPPAVDAGLAPAEARGYGGFDACSVYFLAPDAMIVVDLSAVPAGEGVVALDVARPGAGVRRVQLATGAGRDALLPAGPAVPVPPTVVRTTAVSGTVYAARTGDGALLVGARGLAFPGGPTVDLAVRRVPLWTYPPGPAVPAGR